MSDKWEYRKAKNRLFYNIFNSKQDIIARTGYEKDAKQIVHEHNIHDELVEAIDTLMEAYGVETCDCGGSSLCAVCNALEIVKQAKGKS